MSNYFEIAAGDIILSGTPSGVGPVEKDNDIEIAIEGLGTMSIRVI